MAAVNRDNTAINTILATRAEYKPLDSSSMDETARWIRNTKYQEAEAKKQRNRANLDQLAAIEGLGLPKEAQGELNYDKDQLINRVRSGELDVDSYEFKAGLQGILGKYKQFDDIINTTKQAIADDNLLIEKDEFGNPVDNKGKLVQDFTTMYESEYDPNKPASEKIGMFRTQLGNITKPLELDLNEMSTTINRWNTMNADQQVEFLAGAGGGYGKEVTTTSTPEQLRDALKSTLINQNQAALMQKYTMANTTAPFKEWADSYVGALMPVDKTQEKLTVDQRERDAAAMRRTMAGKEKEEETFSKIETPIELDKLDPLEVANSGGDMRKVKVRSEIERLNPDMDVDFTSVKQVKVVPKKKGEMLKEIDIKGTVGTLESIFVDKDGRGMAVINVPSDTRINKGTTKDGGTSTSTGVKGTVRQTVQLRPEDTEYINQFYGLEGSAPQSNNTSSQSSEQKYKASNGYEYTEQQLLDAGYTKEQINAMK